METVSWIAVAVIVIALVLLASKRYSPTMVLVISNVMIFAVMEIGYYGTYNWTLFELGLKSSYLFAGEEPWALVTSMFLHADFFHLIFNMLFLIAIGIPLEARIGRRRFIAVYFLGGIAGSIVFSIAEWNSAQFMILIGASGAISALLGAMLMLYPKDKITFFLGPLLTNRFSVWVPILVWFVLQVILFSFDDSPVAYTAHIGGFAAGMGIAWAVRPRAGKAYVPAYDISALRPLCTTHSQKEMYGYAENARDDETRKIWVERILADVRCPVCGAAIKAKRKGFECGNNHVI